MSFFNSFAIGKPESEEKLFLEFNEDGNIVFTEKLLQSNEDYVLLFREFIQQGCEYYYDPLTASFEVVVSKEDGNE